MEAQRFPEDYDGIVSVAPANYWTQVLPGSIWDEQALIAEPGGALTAKKLPAITAAVLAACHGEDGILDNPRQCRLRPLGATVQGGRVRRLSDFTTDHHAAENLFRAARRRRQFGLSGFRAGR